MADNYLQFSEVIPGLSKEEEAWLRHQLEPICVFGDKEYPEDGVPAALAKEDPDWSGPRFLRDHPDYERWGNGAVLDFEFQFDDDDDEHPNGLGRHLWIYSDSWGDARNVAWLLQRFLRAFRPNECWGMTYSISCSKPRVGEFGGGAVFVTADEILWDDTYRFVERHQEAFEKKKDKRKRYYSMAVKIRGYDPSRHKELMDAAEGEWPFEGWASDCGDPPMISAEGKSWLQSGETVKRFVRRLSEAIWRANGGFCSVIVEVAYLEDPPYVKYELSEKEYERFVNQQGDQNHEEKENEQTV